MTDGKPKATIEQVAWVFECLLENARAQGTFGSLIYGLMGFGIEAYKPLCLAGGIEVNNRMGDEPSGSPPPPGPA